MWKGAVLPALVYRRQISSRACARTCSNIRFCLTASADPFLKHQAKLDRRAPVPAPSSTPARRASGPVRHSAFNGAAVELGAVGCRHCSRLQAIAADYGKDLSVAQTSYLAVGLAHCFEKDDNGKLSDRFVVEPLAANSLECMANGAATCFKAVTSLTLEDALRKDKTNFPEQFSDATWCSDYEFRCAAAARTWLRPHAQDNLSDIVPLGQVRSNFNFNLERKRVLNFVNVVSDEDNVKQDMSIDVYGRKEKQEADDAQKEASAKPAEAAQAAPDEDDDLDALLSS